MEERTVFNTKFLSDRFYKNKGKVKEVEKILKYKLRRPRIKAIDKIADDLKE